jgi:Protein of unknown function (DUF3237)
MDTGNPVAAAVAVIPLATMDIVMAVPVRLDGTPVGTRVIVEFEQVVWLGERIRATSRGRTSGDWVTIGPDQTGCLDFRMLLETDDGALIYVHGAGRNDAARFVEGAANYFTMSFETGDDRYRWLNRIQAVAKGALAGEPRRISFAVYELR